MSLFNILNSNNYGTYNRHVARKIGLHSTVLLSEILDKYEYFQINKKTISLPDEEGVWFYLTAETIEERTTLSEKEQRPCIEKLIKLGFIRKKVSGLPAKRYFQVNEQRLVEFILNEINFTSLDKRPDLNGQKGETGLDKRPNSPIYKNPIEEPKEDIYREAKAPEPPISPSPSSKRKKATEQKIEVKPSVFLTPAQQDALKKRLEPLKIDPDDVYQHLSDWKIGKEIQGGNDYCTITNWVIDAVHKKNRDKSNVAAVPPAKKVQDRVEIERSNRELGKKINKKYFNLVTTHVINTSNSGFIEFNLGDRGGIVKIEYISPGFREQCLNYLRRMMQDINGL
jgi:hypothetical protein